MLEHLAFRGVPTRGKVAVGGEWERAVTFGPGEVVEVAGHEVACEAFFGSAFFGVRRHGADLTAVVTAFSRAMAEATDGAGFFAQVAQQLHLPLAEHFLYAELGAEGAWRSVGPVRIEHLADVDAVWQDLQSTALMRDREHDKAVEFTFANGDGDNHWFALPVSRDRRLDAGLLEAALRDFREG